MLYSVPIACHHSPHANVKPFDLLEKGKIISKVNSNVISSRLHFDRKKLLKRIETIDRNLRSLEQWFSTFDSWRPTKQNNTQFADPYIDIIVL